MRSRHVGAGPASRSELVDRSQQLAIRRQHARPPSRCRARHADRKRKLACMDVLAYLADVLLLVEMRC
jgi:hypothetical protein